MLWNYFHVLPDQDGCQLLYWLQHHFPLCSILSLTCRHSVLEWLSLIHPSPWFPLSLLQLSASFPMFIQRKKNTAMSQSTAFLLQGLCMQSCRDLRAGQTSPNAWKALSACVVQVVSVQQRYPARELKFEDNSLSETKSMYKSSSNIHLS